MWGYSTVDFEWDKAKRLRTIAGRGIDFLDAAALFDGRDLLTVPSPRADRLRIVTARRARDEEKRRYRAAFGG